MGRGGWFVVGGVALLLIGAGGLFVMSNDRMKGPRWTGLLPQMKKDVLELLNRARAAGLDVMFYDGWRSPAQEKKYESKGTSALHDPYNNYHTWGAAADIVFKNSLGEPYWPHESDPRWQQLGAIGKSLGLFWGGDWPHLHDMAHFQLRSVHVATLREQYGTDYKSWLTSQGATV